MSGQAQQGHVLVVDDDPTIARLVTRALGPKYTVQATTSAKEALGWLADGSLYDTVLFDLRMPDMDGLQFYAALEHAHPSLASRAIVFTGGAFDSATRRFLAETSLVKVMKPFRLAKLAQSVAEATAR